MNEIKIQPAKKTDYNEIAALLTANKLPVEDINPDRTHFFVAKSGSAIIGTIGLEKYGQDALLRSMVTSEKYRKHGVAASLLASLFAHAQKLGLKNMYLLTETAKDYFSKKGFAVIDRSNAPDVIKQSSEFSQLCPSSATVMVKAIGSKKKVLFVCIENSNRSQMSQAFAKIYGGDKVEAYSAGSKPSGIINPKAIAAMKELKYDLSVHQSKSLQEVEQYAPFDAVVTMGCGDACPWMPALKFVDWEIPDPKNMEPEAFNKIRDLVAEKVKDLVYNL